MMSSVVVSSAYVMTLFVVWEAVQSCVDWPTGAPGGGPQQFTILKWET